MSETRVIPAVAVILGARCDCGGELGRAGKGLLSDPPQIPVRCLACGACRVLTGYYQQEIRLGAAP